MDPAFICGLGDMYSDEVLWVGAIRPDRQSSRLTSQDVRRLYRALMEALQDAVKARGASVGDHPFRDLQGTPGQYQNELKVFGKEGGSCRRCRNTIVKDTFGAFTSFYCPQCQA
jgi:formamidopyrimidine-DNA glycosylase